LENKNIPNLFILGAPKSGTTALSEYLRNHPNIFFSRIKEPHYFNFDAKKGYEIDLKTYLSLFKDADPHVHKVIGEGSTAYLFSKIAVSEIIKFNSKAKFVVMLRNPVDLVYAWYSQKYYEGLETIGDFESAWRAEEERKKGKNIPRSCFDPAQLFYSEWGKLDEQIERLFSLARKENIKVIIFDDFVKDTKSVYEDVLAFLGVPSDNRQSFPVINESKKPKFVRLQPLFAYLINFMRGLRSMVGLNLGYGSGVFQNLLMANSEPTVKSKLPDDFKSELKTYYRNTIINLSKLLNRDLAYWIEKSL